MRFFYLIGILLMGVLCKAKRETIEELIKREQDEEKREDVYNKLQGLLMQKCQGKDGQDAFDDLNVSNVEDYVIYTVSRKFWKTQKLAWHVAKQICKNKEQEARQCLGSFIQALENCSPPEEKFLPNFMLDAAEGVLDYICIDSNDFMTKMDNSIGCFMALADSDSTDRNMSTSLKFFMGEIPEQYKISKEQLCQDLATEKKNFVDLIEKKCPGSEFKNIAIGLYDEVMHSACETRHRRNLPLGLRF